MDKCDNELTRFHDPDPIDPQDLPSAKKEGLGCDLPGPDFVEYTNKQKWTAQL